MIVCPSSAREPQDLFARLFSETTKLLLKTTRPCNNKTRSQPGTESERRNSAIRNESAVSATAPRSKISRDSTFFLTDSHRLSEAQIPGIHGAASRGPGKNCPGPRIEIGAFWRGTGFPRKPELLFVSSDNPFRQSGGELAEFFGAEIDFDFTGCGFGAIAAVNQVHLA